MDSRDLTRGQAERLREVVVPYLRYLHRLQRLQRRMELQGFPPNDRLYQLVCQTYDKVHNLCVELHYLSCQSGVGREPRSEE